eukprot:jgi/Tetstr1/439703/TSEL_028122.t1
MPSAAAGSPRIALYDSRLHSGGTSRDGSGSGRAPAPAGAPRYRACVSTNIPGGQKLLDASQESAVSNADVSGSDSGLEATLLSLQEIGSQLSFSDDSDWDDSLVRSGKAGASKSRAARASKGQTGAPSKRGQRQPKLPSAAPAAHPGGGDAKGKAPPPSTGCSTPAKAKKAPSKRSATVKSPYFSPPTRGSTALPTRNKADGAADATPPSDKVARSPPKKVSKKKGRAEAAARPVDLVSRRLAKLTYDRDRAVVADQQVTRAPCPAKKGGLPRRGRGRAANREADRCAMMYLRALAGAAAQRAAQRSKRAAEEEAALAECTFRPAINKVSQELAKLRPDRRVPMFERQMMWKDNVEAKLEEARASKPPEDYSECTFSPRISAIPSWLYKPPESADTRPMYKAERPAAAGLPAATPDFGRIMLSGSEVIRQWEVAHSLGPSCELASAAATDIGARFAKLASAPVESTSPDQSQQHADVEDASLQSAERDYSLEFQPPCGSGSSSPDAGADGAGTLLQWRRLSEDRDETLHVNELYDELHGAGEEEADEDEGHWDRDSWESREGSEGGIMAAMAHYARPRASQPRTYVSLVEGMAAGQRAGDARAAPRQFWVAEGSLESGTN